MAKHPHSMPAYTAPGLLTCGSPDGPTACPHGGHEVSAQESKKCGLFSLLLKAAYFIHLQSESSGIYQWRPPRPVSFRGYETLLSLPDYGTAPSK
jgi:hypothetical protein